MRLFCHVCHGKMALEHISRTSVSGSVPPRGLMLLDMLQGAPPCHLVSDLLAGLQPGLVQGLLLQESWYVVVVGSVAAVGATLQVSPIMASMVRRTFRTSAASGCGIPGCVPSYQRRGLHSRAARQSQTGTSRNRRHEAIVEVPPA